MAALLAAEGLNKRFGAVVAAEQVSLSVEAGETVGVIGANGAGKTTFVNMVTGYLKPDSGAIRHDGRDITGLKPRRIARLGIHRSFQIPQIFPELAVFDNMLIAHGIARETRPGAWRALLDADIAARAEQDLSRFGILDYRDQVAGKLPQGVRKLLDIAMAMVGDTGLMLLDEPTSGISADQKTGVMDTIAAALEAAGVTMLFVEHDMEVVERYAPRVVAFYDGRVIADGPTGTVLADADVRTYVIGPELHRRR
ncbi:MAG TPA: ABC transporter ATP-binding protein [Alphaproteobacteria bacterium]